MKVLLTGSEGNIGSVLRSRLEQSGHEVFCIDAAFGWREGYKSIDVVNSGDLTAVFDEFKPDVVYHLAAVVSRELSQIAPDRAYSVNVMGTHHVVRNCQRLNAKLIHFSTSEIYGNVENMEEDHANYNPVNIYGSSKLISEHVVHHYADQYDLEAVIVRPFMIYTEHDLKSHDNAHEARAAINMFVAKLLIGEKVTIHKGTCRGWLHINDACDAFMKFIEFDKFMTFNVGNSDVKSMEELARIICSKLDLNPDEYIETVSVPDHIVINKNPIYTNLTNELKFTPSIGLDEGLDRVIQEERQRLKIHG